ncbi:hypothetical protein DEU38_102445 [Rhodococcus sp. AG1013]|nr:hypothetical protein DEU38_102445 [Rhodococcus sp. AG1013]
MRSNEGLGGNATTAETSTPLAALPLGEQLERLRSQMAAISSRTTDHKALNPQCGRDVLAAPGGLEQLLPARGLPKGTVVACSGTSLLLGMLAAATQDGTFAAVIGYRQLCWLAAVEMGADLSRLAHIPDAGDNALKVLGVLLDGLDMVVLDLSGAAISPSRSRPLVARVRSHRSVLVVTSGDWPGPDLRLDSRPAAYGGIEGGVGRIQSIHLDVRVSGKGIRPRAGRLVLSSTSSGHTSWSMRDPAPDRLAHIG